ncbi:conserved hypothetical protein [Xanthomonas campestris pv. raphani 756C]|nr:conserved hypothetical protein [Xanthomonas campestris pv. raphani 756C]
MAGPHRALRWQVWKCTGRCLSKRLTGVRPGHAATHPQHLPNRQAWSGLQMGSAPWRSAGARVTRG